MGPFVIFLALIAFTFSCSDSAQLNTKRGSASESEVLSEDKAHEFKVGSTEIMIPAGAIASAFKAEVKDVFPKDLNMDLPEYETALAGLELRILHPGSNQPLSENQIIKPLEIAFVVKESLFDLTT